MATRVVVVLLLARRTDAAEVVAEPPLSLEAVKDCCLGQHWTFGIPSVTYEPLWTFTAASAELSSGESGRRMADAVVGGVYGGFLIEVLDTIALSMGFTYSIINAPPYDSLENEAGKLGRDLLNSGTVDFLTNDLSITTKHSDYRVYNTVPFHNSYYTGLVLKTKKPTSLFRFLDPYTLDMYMTILGMVVATALLLSLLDTFWPADPTVLLGKKKQRLCKMNDIGDLLVSTIKGTYHVVAAIFGGEDYEWLTWPLRVLRVGLLLVVLIVNATYTANLAAVLSAPSIQVHGPSSMEQLSDSKVCVLHPYWNFLGNLYGNTVTTASREEIPDIDKFFDMPSRKEWCREQLNKGGCDIWLHDEAILHRELLSNCSSREKAEFVKVLTIMYGFVSADRVNAANLSTGLMALTNMKEMTTIKTKYFGIGRTCPADSSDSDAINVEMMAGVYIIYATVMGVAVLMALMLRAKYLLVPHGNDELDHTATDGQMLRTLLNKMDQLLDKDSNGPANSSTGKEVAPPQSSTTNG